MEFLILKRMRVEEANALTSPYSAGIPSLVSIGGWVEALFRSAKEKGMKAEYDGFFPLFHRVEPKFYPKGYGEMVLVAKKPPLRHDGQNAPIPEEPLVNCEISLFVSMRVKARDRERFLRHVERFAKRFPFAGGNVVSLGSVGAKTLETPADAMREVGPGYVLVYPEEEFAEAVEKNDGDAMEAFLEFFEMEKRRENDDGSVSVRRLRKGWYVPMGVGYMRISDSVPTGTRDDGKEKRYFVESVAVPCEVKMPTGVFSFGEILWSPHADGDFFMYKIKKEGE